MKALIILLFAIPSCYHQETIPVNYNIVLCAGQSNMVGLATIEAQDSGSLAWLWNDSSWEVADGPLNRYSNIAAGFKLSMANSFGKEAARHSRPDRTGLVVNARSTTGIQEWTDTYMILSIQRAKDALMDNPGSRITAVLWHQGESNRVDPQNWMPNFRMIRHQVDSLLGYNVPILVGGLNNLSTYVQINDTIRQCITVHDCYYVSSDSLTTIDGLHFDSPSQREFGLRYYNTYHQVTGL